MAEETLRDTLSRVIETPGDAGQSSESAEPIVESKAAETPPAEPKAGETPPAEPKAGEIPPAEPKAGETPPAEPKAAEPKAAEVKKGKATPAEAARSPIRPPESWKPAVRDQHWSKLPVAVQAEIHRRERQVEGALQESAEARRGMEQVHGLFSTYKDVFEYEKRPPMETINSLLNISRSLRFAPAPQKAQLMAQVINGFGVDVKLLDQALSMLVHPQDPVQQQNANQQQLIEQALQKHLAPVRDFMGRIQSSQTVAAQAAEQKLQNEITAFANDPKNEYFEIVKDVMADIMEVGAKHGQQISLQDAYQRAILANNDLAGQFTKSRLQEAAAKLSTPAEQAALRAGLSVTGAPAGSSSAHTGGVNLRTDIEAAVARHSGRA